LRKLERILLLAGLVQAVPSVVVGISAILRANIVLSALSGISVAVGLFLLLTVIMKRDLITACYPPIMNFLLLISCIAVGLCGSSSEVVLLTVISFIVASIGFILIVLKEELLK